MKRFTFIALYILTIMQLSAQDNILSLISELKADNRFYEHFINDSQNNCKRHMLVYSAYRNEEKEPLNQRFIAAFEKELPNATESDRYQIHSEKGDTLAYTLAYSGKNNNNTLEQMNLSIPYTFKLDVTDEYVQMRMHERTGDYAHEPKDLTPINKLCEEIGKIPGVEKSEVLYETDGLSNHTISHYYYNGPGKCHATRYRIPVKGSEVIKNKVTALCDSYIATNQDYSITYGFNQNIDIRFVDPNSQKYFVALSFYAIPQTLSDKNYVYLLQVHSECSYIPLNWNYIKQVKNGEVIFEEYTPESVKESFNRMRNRENSYLK